MIIIFGTYQWQPQVLGYRNDYCLKCNEPQVAEYRETRDFFYLYYIPVIPLGRSQHWHCCECNNDPHVQVKTRRVYKMVAAILCWIFAGVFWALPAAPADVFLFDCLGAGGTVVGLLFWLSWLFHKPELTLTEHLEDIEHLSPTYCLNCDAELDPNPDQCPDCFVEYFETPEC